jgi:adenylate kinase family enzyme
LHSDVRRTALPFEIDLPSPMRVAIIGNSGSGKSTLAAHLADTTGAATLDLDIVTWEPGQIAVARPRDAAVEEVLQFCQGHPEWIVEGCYGDLISATLPFEPLLLFLDPGLQACQNHCRQRPWEPHKYVTKAAQDARLEMLLDWVADYYQRDGELSWRQHQDLFDSYPGAKRRLTTP